MNMTREKRELPTGAAITARIVGIFNILVAAILSLHQVLHPLLEVYLKHSVEPPEVNIYVLLAWLVSGVVIAFTEKFMVLEQAALTLYDKWRSK